MRIDASPLTHSLKDLAPVDEHFGLDPFRLKF
jgi:hypothetical protein